MLDKNIDSTGTKGQGGLTIGLNKEEKLYIGDNIVLWIQRNTPNESDRYSVRVQAPKNIKILRQTVIDYRRSNDQSDNT